MYQIWIITYICKFMKPEQEFPAQDPHISRPHFLNPPLDIQYIHCWFEVYKISYAWRHFMTNFHVQRFIVSNSVYRDGQRCGHFSTTLEPNVSAQITRKVELISKILHPYILYRFFSSSKLSGCITGLYFQELLATLRNPHPLQTTTDMALQITRSP